ncbi:unnamed protein product, partial [Closterium sp. Naga37s-1]
VPGPAQRAVRRPPLPLLLPAPAIPAAGVLASGQRALCLPPHALPLRLPPPALPHPPPAGAAAGRGGRRQSKGKETKCVCTAHPAAARQPLLRLHPAPPGCTWDTTLPPSAHVRVVWHVEGQQALWGVQAGGLLQQGPPAARIPSASADAESAGGAGNDVSAADWRVTVLDRGGWKEWEMVVEEEPEEGEEGEEGENGEEAGREGGSEGEKGPGAGAGGAEVRRLMREYRERTRAEGPIAASELEGFGDVRRSCEVGGVGDGVAVCMGWAWSGHGVGMEWAWGGLAHGVGAGADAEKKQWAAFQAVIAKAPDQVIRYCRSATARPLWPQLQGQPPSQAAIPPCGGCGAPRIFEFQVLPQIIYYSAPDATADSALDFATLAVYVCPNSCCRSSPLSTAQQSSVAVPRSVDSGVEATAVGASAEGSSSAAGSRDAGSGDVKGCEGEEEEGEGGALGAWMAGGAAAAASLSAAHRNPALALETLSHWGRGAGGDGGGGTVGGTPGWGDGGEEGEERLLRRRCVGRLSVAYPFLLLKPLKTSSRLPLLIPVSPLPTPSLPMLLLLSPCPLHIRPPSFLSPLPLSSY